MVSYCVSMGLKVNGNQRILATHVKIQLQNYYGTRKNGPGINYNYQNYFNFRIVS